MKTCTKCGEEKPLDKFTKRKSSPDGLRGQCKTCRNTQSAEWVKKNKEKRADIARRSKQKHIEARRQYNREYYLQNSERTLARCRRRQAAKLQRTPSWANEQLIAAYYMEAKRLEELTGIQFHVDHIIPLQGELVSGLHVETNLQLLTAHENMSKSNSFDPELFCV